MSDLISRAAAIDALGERPLVWTDDDQYTLGERNQYDRDRLVIETLPSAEMVGKWKYETMRHIMTGEMRTVRICSECGGGWFRYDLSDGVEDAEPNYCPNCGADMRGEEDE